MANELVTVELRNQLHVLAGMGAVGGLLDPQLLGLVLDGHDVRAKTAFTALVQRHGPMVLAICQQILGDAQDAEDAFQATFLVLAQKADSVRKADSLASWLHGVALRVSARTRVNTARRKAGERRAAAMRIMRAQDPDPIDQSWPELHEEIARLPGRYREPVVLCYLQGLTTEAAAERLRCPRGTILSRLSRARDRLRERLKQRGFAPMGILAIQPPDTVFPRPVLSERLLSAALNCGAQAIAGPAAAAPAAATVVSVAETVLRAMYWTKVKTTFLWGLGTAALLAGVGTALAFQDARGSVQAPPEAQPDIAAKGIQQADDPSSAIFIPLPAKPKLTGLLQQAADEAITLAKERPDPGSWMLTTIATVQAKTGDPNGANATFAAAVREANGDFGGTAEPRTLWRVGHFQAECGLTEEARESLRNAAKRQPGVVDDPSKDSWTLATYGLIIKDQARLAVPEDTRKTVTLMLDFTKQFFGSSKLGNARSVEALRVASALASSGDFDAAFTWSDGIPNRGDAFGEIALGAATSLPRDEARRFVHEAAGRIVVLATADEKYSGLSDLAEAQARIGEVEAAKASALMIGVGPTRAEYDLSDAQPYTFCRIARVQIAAGDHAAAQETLREAFRTVNDHPGMRGRDGQYFRIADTQIQSGDIAGAQKSVDAMSGHRAKILALIAVSEAAAGKHTVARATIRKALVDAGVSVENPPAPDRNLANLPGVRQNVPAAMRALLAEVQAVAGDVPAALKAVQSIDDPDFQRMALQHVVEVRAVAGDIEGALRLIKAEATEPDSRRSSLEGLGRGIDSRLSIKALNPPAQ